MGKQGSPRSPRPENPILDTPFGLKDYQFRCSEKKTNGDPPPPMGRRMSVVDHQFSKGTLFHSLENDATKYGAGKGVSAGKKHMSWIHRHVRSIVATLLLMGFLFLLDTFLFSILDPTISHSSSAPRNSTGIKESRAADDDVRKKSIEMYSRLVDLASGALTEKEFKLDGSKLWEEPYQQESMWKPCADRKGPKRKPLNSTGYILVSANGGLNQQRVAVCNAVAVSSLLNATLVIPKFLYSNVWKDPSQFGDIYQEECFMDVMQDEINIVKELPSHLRSLDLEAIGSLITDGDIPKEAMPLDYSNVVLPRLLRNGVVHFLGFGNRLGFDPLPSELQSLRCKCNFHALKFVPKIQRAASLLIRRIRKYDFAHNSLDQHLLGNFIPQSPSEGRDATIRPSKYLALHLRFEIDMVAYSLCEFGGGENEKMELQSYRETHFPLLLERLRKSGPVSPEELRQSGRCPLTPEEAALVLAGLGFRHGTYIYLAGSQIYGGQSRMQPLTSLYPNLVTKEDLLTRSELEPFKNFSSQLAALDFIACATADVFAMTDSGSQLANLITGLRTYYGNGRAPTLRPSKKRFADIMLENSTIGWKNFAARIGKMIEENQRVRKRGYGRSIYRQPRCSECMCKQAPAVV